MVQIELCQLHIGSVFAKFTKRYVFSALLSYFLQLFLNPLISNLGISLFWCPSAGMYEGCIKWDITEEIEQVIIVHRTIGTYLSLDKVIAGNLLICKNLVAGIHTRVVIIPVHLEVSDTCIKLMLVHRDIKVTPSNTYTVRNTPYIRTLVHDIGHTEPSPVHITHAAVNRSDGSIEVGIRKLVSFRSQLRI